MKQYRVAILGATGAVGQEMMKVLEEQNFPVSELKLLASSRSAGKTLYFQGKPITIEEATEESFDNIDIVLGAAENDIAKRFCPLLPKKELLSSTTAAHTVWIRMSLWSFRKSIRRTPLPITASLPIQTARRSSLWLHWRRCIGFITHSA